MHVQMVNDNYDVIHNPLVKEKYPILYKEVIEHDKVSMSSWYDLSENAGLEYQQYIEDKEIGYVEDGVENTYAIVSNTWLPDDFDFEEGCVEDETYKVEDVIYSVAKINREIVENFLSL